jgi:hypothetical protein
MSSSGISAAPFEIAPREHALNLGLESLVGDDADLRQPGLEGPLQRDQLGGFAPQRDLAHEAGNFRQAEPLGERRALIRPGLQDQALLLGPHAGNIEGAAEFQLLFFRHDVTVP